MLEVGISCSGVRVTLYLVGSSTEESSTAVTLKYFSDPGVNYVSAGSESTSKARDEDE
jgi:hypothetical protein